METLQPIYFPYRFLLQKKMHYACRDILLKPMTFAGPNNYLQVPGFFRKPRMFVKFKFRSWDYTGLLMFTRFADDLGALELGLSEGQINVTIFQTGKKKIQFAAGKCMQIFVALCVKLGVRKFIRWILSVVAKQHCFFHHRQSVGVCYVWISSNTQS